MATERVLSGFLEEIRTSLESGEGPAASAGEADREALGRLAADLESIGIFGLLTTLAGAPDPTDDVFLEVRRRIDERARAHLLEDKVAEAESASFEEILKLYAVRKGSRGPELLRRLIANTIFEFYELRDHGLFIEDVARIFDVVKAATGPTEDAHVFFSSLAALSGDTAKFMLGLFPEQIGLIFRITARQAEKKEIDEAFKTFAPKALSKRLFAVMKTLLQKEKRFRLACIVFARLRGVALSRDALMSVEPILAVKETGDLVKRALETGPARQKWLDYQRSRAADIAALEAAF